MISVTKNSVTFKVNAFKGSFITILYRALHNFYLSIYTDYFWQMLQNGLWENETFTIFDKYLNLQHSYIDIGAWRGPTVLYGCQRSKHCYAVEPDPVAYTHLLSNISLNPTLIKKISIYNGALSNKSGNTILSARLNLGDTMSTILKANSNDCVKVPCLKFNDYTKLYKIADCDFIKMDVEGAESIIISYMNSFIKKYKPTLYISMHPAQFNFREKDSKAILQTISQYPHIYDISWHLISNEKFMDLCMTKNKFSFIATFL